MSLRSYLIFMSVATALCWAAWLCIVLRADPAQAGLLLVASFYCSLFLALMGTCAVTGFLLRRATGAPEQAAFRSVRETLRQSILVGAGVALGLLLLHGELLTWWNGLILILFYAVIEIIIISRARQQSRDYVK